MKKLTANYIPLLLLVSLLGGNAEAWVRDDGQESGNCCFSSCYECGCNPLYCGAWDLQVQGGVNPILWRSRDPFSVVACTTTVTDNVFTFLNETPKFRQFFKVPWIVGGQIGYAWSDNTRVYGEFNYSQARAKDVISLTSNGTGLPEATIVLSLSKYSLFDAYVGVRYYWDRWCDRVSFFLGGKVGLTRHKAVHFNTTSADNNAVTFPDVEGLQPFFAEGTAVNLFNNSTVVSGGANIGLDFCFCGNWSFVITGEVVASCGPRTNSPIAFTETVATGLPANPFITNIFPGGTQTELRFPVTAAIRYSF